MGRAAERREGAGSGAGRPKERSLPCLGPAHGGGPVRWLMGETVAKMTMLQKCLEGRRGGWRCLPLASYLFLRNEDQEGCLRKETRKHEGPEEALTLEITATVSRKDRGRVWLSGRARA